MSDPTFTTHGNEPVEARIVSWVLGEASAFEAAELERLCEAQPELMIFKRRMEALHGMLKESAHPTDDRKWKLPSDRKWKLSDARRAVIEEIAGREEEKQKEHRISRSGRRAGWAIAACVLFAIVALALLDPFDLIKVQTWQKIMPEHVDFLPSAASDRQAEMKRVPLSTSIPPELIEGTPKPIDVPNLESPTNGPASGGTVNYGMSLGGAQRDEHRYREVAPMSAGAAQTRPAAKPEGMRRGMAVAESAPTAIPLPSPAPEMQSLDHAGENAYSGKANLSESGAKRAADAPVDAFAAPVPSEPNAPLARASVVPRSEKLAARESGRLIANNQSPAVQEELSYLSSVGDDEQAGAFKSDLGNSVFNDAERLNQEALKQEGADKHIEDISSRRALAFEKAKVIPGKDSDKRRMYDLDGLKGKKALKKAEAAPEPIKPVDAGEETSAAQEPYSTFSLNISDASFRIAQAALAKGEQPDPAGIQVEQFYNAVNYGDPAPAAGQPVAGIVEQVAHPIVPGRTLVRVAIKTAAAGRSPQQSLRLTLLADQSGSMVREDRREAMNQALKGLADLLTPKDLVNVIGFARTPHLLAEGLPGQQAKQLQGLINMEANEGGTNLEEAMKLGEQLAKRYQQQGAQNRIVLFTDGAANLGDADPQSLAKKVEQLRQAGISFDIAGIAADGINDELLAELARKGNGRYYIVGKGESDQLAKQLAGAFNPAAENVKVQVRFNPARVGGYKLIGFEKDRLKKEDFRNDKVDAAEMAAEEAGVAIYQVEPLPEGEGELGEVSVRFRDTASGEMVERTWTIPYDASAPGIEQSTASMQLAVMSMLAGEKLKGGPLADAIDFKQLGKAQANVRQAFGADQRVGEMLQMIDQLK